MGQIAKMILWLMAGHIIPPNISWIMKSCIHILLAFKFIIHAIWQYVAATLYQVHMHQKKHSSDI